MTNLRDILNIPGPKGSDIDDVIVPLKDKIPTYVNIVLGYKLIYKPFMEHDYVWLALERLKIFEDAGITRDDVSMMLKYMELTGVIENIMPTYDCVKSLKILSESDPLYLVTSRGDRFYNNPVEMTNRWLNNVKKNFNDFIIPKVIYNHNKEEVITDKNIVLLFEDNPLFALNVLKSQTERNPVYVILFNQPWNKINLHDHNILSKELYLEKKLLLEELESYNNKLLFRVNDWSDVLRNLNK